MLELKATARALCETRETRDLPKTVSLENAAEIAAEFMTTFYDVQMGSLETPELRTIPVPFRLVCFSDAIKRPLRQMFFVVRPPDGRVVEPRVARRM
jgi:hypothetical protein